MWEQKKRKKQTKPQVSLSLAKMVGYLKNYWTPPWKVDSADFWRFIFSPHCCDTHDTLTSLLGTGTMEQTVMKRARNFSRSWQWRTDFSLVLSCSLSLKWFENQNTPAMFSFLSFLLCFLLLSLVSNCPFSVLLTPFLFSASACLLLSLSPPPPPLWIPWVSLTPSVFRILTFFPLSIAPLCTHIFIYFPFKCVPCLSLLLFCCPLSFSPSVLFASSSSLLHHKVDGWMIHLSLCPQTAVILILLHS